MQTEGASATERLAVVPDLRWLDGLDATCLSGSSSLLLTGSMAAGEHHLEGRFGDVDLYLFGTAKERDAVLAATCGDSRVHVAVLSDRVLGRLPHTYRLFEARELGVVLRGPDPRQKLPFVTAESLHSGDLNDILAWRLLSCGKARGARDLERISYTAAKNFLDVGIWLSGQMDLMVAGHQARIEGLARLDQSEATCLSALTSIWLSDATEALMVKRGELCWLQPEHRLERAIALLAAAARLVLAESAPRSELSDASVRRRLSVTRNLLRTSRGLSWRVRWAVLKSPHRELLRAACDSVAWGNRDVWEFECIHKVVFGGAVE